MKIVKNKVAPPFRIAEFDITYGKGISREGALLDVAVEMGIVSKAGSWYSYGKDRLGQGREAVKARLADDLKMAEELERKIKIKAREEGLPIEVGVEGEEPEELGTKN